MAVAADQRDDRSASDEGVQRSFASPASRGRYDRLARTRMEREPVRVAVRYLELEPRLGAGGSVAQAKFAPSSRLPVPAYRA